LTSAAGDRLKALVITGLGSGYLRPAPGTWGSLAAVAVYAAFWWLSAAIGAPRWTVDVLALAGIAVSSGLSGLWGPWAIDHFGGRSRKPDDPSFFVLDEFAGQWIALLWLPPIAAAGFWAFVWVAGGQFVLFRIMDVIKPPPARQLERLPHGWGILCDDLMAGVYAGVVGQLAWRVAPLANWLGLQA